METYNVTIKKDSTVKKPIESKLQKGCTTLMYACQQGLTNDVVKELRTNSRTVYCRDKRNKHALHYCSGKEDLVAAATVAIAAPELMKSSDDSGFTPLHLAVIQGNLPLVNLFLANNVDINALDNEGHSVIHWATVCSELEPLKAVLNAGADVTLSDQNGGNPLHYAAQMCGTQYDSKGKATSSESLALEILETLLIHPGSSVSVTDKDGRQPILWAASAGSTKAVLMLIKFGAKIESCDKDGLTALHCAASRGHTSVIDALIRLCGAPVDIIDGNGCTALHYAVCLGHADATSILLQLGAEPNRQDKKGRTPAHCGCAKGQYETVRLLYNHGANLWLRNAKGDLPIHEAAASGRLELLQWLIEQKSNYVNSANNDGKTMLHIAAENDCIDICKMLLEIGADPNAIQRFDDSVLTPLDCAMRKGHRSTAKFLQLNGGLPSNKLRLSGKKVHTSLDEQIVQPLHAECSQHESRNKEKSSSKTYLFYVEQAGSECSEDCKVKHRKRSCSCHHKSSRRRRRSCDSFSCSKSDSSSVEMSRSKSNIEIRRRRKHKYRSEESYSDDSSDSCSHYEHRTTHHKKKSEKASSHSSPKKKSVDKKKKQKTKKGYVHSDKSDKVTPKRPASAGKTKLKENRMTSGGKEKIKSISKTTSVSNDVNEKLMEQSTNMTAVMENTVENEKNVDEGKLEPIESKLEQKSQVSQLETEVSNDKDIDKANEMTIEEGSGPNSQNVSIDKSEVTSEVNGILSDAVKLAEIVKEKPEETDMNPPLESSNNEVVEENEALATTIDDPTVPKNITETQDENKQNTVSSSKPTIVESPTKTNMLTFNENVSVREIPHEPDECTEASYGQCDNDYKEPECIQTIINKDCPCEASKESHIEPKSSSSNSLPCTDSFAVLSSSTNPKSFQVIADNDLNGIQSDLNEREVLLPRRNSAFKICDLDTSYTDSAQYQNKDQDSGFEPSPRLSRSQAERVSRSSATTLPRSYSSRARSCGSNKTNINMSTVSLSIQQNIKRYYMERKIFQHLLELKSLQIRSSKVNEAILVKRAVDDYNKSIDAMSSEAIAPLLKRYPHREYTFKNFEIFLYETLKSLQMSGTYNFQNISDVYKEAEKRLNTVYNPAERAMECTSRTHRCLHATHAYTGIPCAAYIPFINHHTIPKIGFGPYKTTGVGSFYLPKIGNDKSKVSLELSHGNHKQLITLPSNKLHGNKRYYVTFTVKDKLTDKLHK